MSNSFRFFVGIDLGSQTHHVHVINAGGDTIGQRSVKHCGSDIEELFRWIANITSAPASEIAVAAESPNGAVVEASLDRGYGTFSINPKQLDRFRDRFSVAGAKDDRRDALVLAHSLRTDQHHFRRLDRCDPRLLRLRELSRAEEGIQQDFRRSANQLWQLLQRYFPALLTLAPSADEPWLWSLLETASTPAQAARLRPARLECILKKHQIRRLDATQLRQTLQQMALPLADGLSHALAEQVLLLLPRLRLLHQQLAQLRQRIEKLIDELAGDTNFQEHRDVEILLSVPGVGRVFTATVLAEATAALQQRDYHACRALAGVAPVTAQSGKTKLVSMRQACNRRLRNAIFHAANVHSQRDDRAHQHYLNLRKRGHSRGRALRSVADRLLALIFVLLRNQQNYDPARRSETPPSEKLP